MRPSEAPMTSLLNPQVSKRKRCLEYDTGVVKLVCESDYSRKKKRVKFAVADDGDIVKTESPSKIVHSDLNKPKMWWNRQEKAEISDRCYRAIRGFRRDHMDQVRHYIGVFDRCTQSPTRASSEYLEKATLILPSSVRGLEWGIAPTTKSHRRTHVQEILNVQAQLQCLSQTLRDKILSTRSVKSSRPCRVIARILADGDAKSASGHVQQGPKRRNRCTMIPTL